EKQARKSAFHGDRGVAYWRACCCGAAVAAAPADGRGGAVIHERDDWERVREDATACPGCCHSTTENHCCRDAESANLAQRQARHLISHRAAQGRWGAREQRAHYR